MSKSRFKTSEAVPSGRALARAVGRSPSAVAEWLKRPDWPFGPGPWTAQQVRHEIPAWASRTLKVDAGNPLVRAARLELMKQQLAALRFENRLTQGKYLLLADAEPLLVRAVVDTRTALCHLHWTLSADVVGKPEAEIRAALESAVRDIGDNYARDIDQIRQLDVFYFREIEREAHRRGRSRRTNRPQGQGHSRAGAESEAALAT